MTKEEKAKADKTEERKDDKAKHPESNAQAQKRIEECEKKQAEYLETLQRVQAEFDNYRKRVEKENARFKEYASADAIAKVLPVLDSFELALKNNNDAEKFKKGVELIYAQLFSVLEDLGLRKIECINTKFDPYRHEVLMVDEKSECKDGTIIEEFQRGYMLKDIVLRHSKVKIAKNNNDKCHCERNDETKNEKKNEKKDDKNQKDNNQKDEIEI